jgi:hypothetical protein
LHVVSFTTCMVALISLALVMLHAFLLTLVLMHVSHCS